MTDPLAGYPDNVEGRALLVWLVARLKVTVARFCPAECDGDCPALCHERHKPLSKQDHYCCPDCRMTSFNPNAVINRYCGNCHKFEEGG